MRLAVIGAALLCLIGGAARAEDEVIVIPHRTWSFNGPFGTFDRAAAQRGFQVYAQVCATCHALKHAFYRDLKGIGLSEEQIKAAASNATIATIGDDGQPAERPGLPADHFRSPYPNEKAARAALNGALPPDLSLIIKARDEGADYLYALLTSYSDSPPMDKKTGKPMEMGAGMMYNAVYPGHQIAMPPPLSDGSVPYTDGTGNKMEQEAIDVVTFLAYISEPETETRKRLGVKVVFFFLIMTGLSYAIKRRVWADVEH